MTIGKWILVALALLVFWAYFYEHRLDDYYKIKKTIKEVVKDW